MTDPYVAPKPYPTDVPVPVAAYPAANQAAITPLELTPADMEEIDRLYGKLKPEGIAEARAHVMVHTPAKYAAEMQARIDADFPPPPEADPALAPAKAPSKNLLPPDPPLGTTAKHN